MEHTTTDAIARRTDAREMGVSELPPLRPDDLAPDSLLTRTGMGEG